MLARKNKQANESPIVKLLPETNVQFATSKAQLKTSIIALP